MDRKAILFALMGFPAVAMASDKLGGPTSSPSKPANVEAPARSAPDPAGSARREPRIGAHGTRPAGPERPISITARVAGSGTVGAKWAKELTLKKGVALPAIEVRWTGGGPGISNVFFWSGFIDQKGTPAPPPYDPANPLPGGVDLWGCEVSICVWSKDNPAVLPLHKSQGENQRTWYLYANALYEKDKRIGPTAQPITIRWSDEKFDVGD
jgi:hypothetical protein